MKLLEDNNIVVLEFARIGENKLSLEQEDGKRFYALGDREKHISHISVLDIVVFYL